MLFAFLCTFLVISLFKMGPNLSADVLSSVPKHKEAVTCFMEKMHVLDKLHSGVSYSAVGCKFNVNGSTIYIKQGVFKEKCTLNNITY